MITKSQNVYHRWANQIAAKRGGLKARNSSSTCSFENSRCYSYRACIGNIVQCPENVNSSSYTRIALINARYDGNTSVTTQKHIRYAKSACSMPCFTVPIIEPESLADHQANLEYLEFKIADLKEKAKRARRYKPYHLELALALTQAAQTYAQFFGISGADHREGEIESLRLEVRKLRRERAIAEYEGCCATFGIRPQPTSQLVFDDRGEVVRDQAFRDAEKEYHNRTNEEKIADWRAGKPAWVPYEVPTMLRIKGERVETSRGAVVPLSDAIAALPLVMRLIRSGNETPLNRCHTIGGYTIHRVGPSGMTIGCHFIPADEIERFAAGLRIKSLSTWGTMAWNR